MYHFKYNYPNSCEILKIWNLVDLLAKKGRASKVLEEFARMGVTAQFICCIADF